jgi:ubiquinone/menaquinone biosynthesis C-methylase UbiE
MKMRFSEHFRALSQDPVRSVTELGLAGGQRVVDLGAGLGYFTVPAANLVGPSGFVYAIEPDPERSRRISQRVAAEGLQNVKVIATSAEHLEEIPTGSIDTAFSAFTYHHFNDKKAALSEIKRVLHEGGTFYIWDRIPGLLIRFGTRPPELGPSTGGFSNFELLSASKTLRARFTK